MNKDQVQQKAAKALQERLSRYWQEEFLRRHDIKASQATLSRWASGKQAIPLHVLIKLGIVEFKS